MLHAELQQLGLTPFFSQQIAEWEMDNCSLARVIEVQRSGLKVSDGIAVWQAAAGQTAQALRTEERPTVGDWLLLDKSKSKVERVLERKSLFSRVAAGEKLQVQAIAANVDTLFVVTSCNDEFNESRLERYLALAVEARVDPIVVLTKADLTTDQGSYETRARAVVPGIPVETVNALVPASLDGLRAWIQPGTTIALVGSSGVGKSTLVNTLSADSRAQTAAIRDDDAKGRHTTTFRSLHRLPNGGLLIDVPGMRELKIAEVDASLRTVFGEIEALAEKCRFKNCSHDSEPGCAVREALESGEIDIRRWNNYRKLLKENAQRNRSLAEQRAQGRKFMMDAKQLMKAKRDLGQKR